jgi:oligosaccharyltransferase complex subunit alpha (ribophorin I)
MRNLSILLLLAILAACICAESISFNPSIVHTDVHRIIDISSHVEEVTTTVKFINQGTKEINSYLIAIPAEKIKLLSYVEGSRGSGRSEEKFITTLTNQTDIKGISGLNIPLNTAWAKVDLKEGVKAGAAASLIIVATFTRTIVPFPAEIRQEQQQLVNYADSVYFFTPYKTVKQSTTVKLASSTVESYTKKQSTQRGSEIEYGPFTDIEGFDSSPLYIHYQNNAPFATATRMIKEIEISHWGNVAITENYDLTHSGAKLTGPFSRHEYQKYMNYAPAAYRSITATLPHHARDIYYRDIIGNVSTSHVRRSSHQTTMEVEPRFPMFGGWKADLQIGYNLPIRHYLSTHSENSQDYYLTIGFGSMFNSLAIDEAVIRVIIPEGATDIQFSTPFEVDSAEFELHKTHLDTLGRPVLVLRKANCVKHHNQIFTVKYHFPRAGILYEPALLISVFALLLAAAMANYRMRLGISDNTATVEKSPPSSQ